MMLKRNKVRVQPSNIQQLNHFGKKFITYTQKILQDFFPSNDQLIKDALEGSIIVDAASG